MNKTRTAVVIPVWNGKELLKKNLPSVLTVGFDEVIIVDDASTDGTVEYLKKQRGKAKFKFLQNKQNRGFSYTVNRGVAATSTDIVFLLNQDVKPTKNIIKPVLQHFKDKDVFGVSLAEQKFSWVKPKIENGFLTHLPGETRDRPHETFWISGGSGAFRKSMWKSLDGLDEIYSPFYWEDVDLSFRALKHGWKLIWEPEAKVIHEHEATINPKNFSQKYLDLIKERNYLIFHWKNLSIKFLITKHLLGLLGRLLKHPGYIQVVIAAKLKLPQIIVRRIKQRGMFVLSDEEIIKKFQG